MAKRKVTWFVEPLDSDTNEKMAKHLLSIGSLVEQFGMKDKEGVNHLVYQIPHYSLIIRFYEEKCKLNLKFKVYFRKNNDGPIKLWTFDEK